MALNILDFQTPNTKNNVKMSFLSCSIMSKHNTLKKFRFLCSLKPLSAFSLFLISLIGLADQNPLPLPLTLQEAESLALHLNFQSKKTQSNTNTGYSEKTNKTITNNKNAEDPNLTFGIQKIMPDNGYPITESDNTLYTVGIQQKLPNADFFSIQRQQSQLFQQLTQQKQKNQALELQRELRNQWLTLYYWLEMEAYIQNTKKNMLQTIPDHHAELKAALSNLNEQEANIQAEIKMSRTQLAKLIGENQASRILPHTLPVLPPPPSLKILQTNLTKHPKLKEDSAMIQAIRTGASLQKEKNKSSMDISANYGVRENEFMGGNPRPDSFSAEFKLNLASQAEQQVQPNSRAHLAELEAAQIRQEADFRQLTSDLQKNYQLWQKESAQNAKLQIKLKNQQTENIKLNVNEAKNKLKNDQTSVTARMKELVILQSLLKTRVNLIRARMNLLYFESSFFLL